ncbi:FAD-dependent oxidoreductase [Arthrobacter sp. EH-1B-1]|uniref:FAD-dependent oxidoreductase n=1 Tax=Arthrobacter vasquezii TaxID=2977629 RepID=A0ABT6CU70_9MICC|nr:FAD-dependent oxidoreductase [Arthrobacter vasquezii]
MDLHHGDTVTLSAPEKPFAVPYGVLLPRGANNVTVTGRAVSAEGSAMDGLRHMGGMMALGHAAGTTAALASAANCSPAELDVQEVRSVLRRQGAIIDPPVTNPEKPS